ncbi:hypothetical protein L873DRAFT_1842437 [Choiromyces venosus 120613-1]|uniref:Uncharacterized protein n=1 Tax=Choiromyces venosus 120613-1 TaxID=1336337 RepID=A0A3N4JWA0_9PEZI|nr:hypothetical protein L873DRAFT_1842437 [Choiromyces venosus 120613-1]
MSITADPVKRLKSQKSYEKLSPEDQDDMMGDAILVTKSETGSEEELMNEAKDALGQVLQVEDLKVKNGVSLHEQGASAPGDQIKFLWDEVSILKLCVPQYSHVWNSFITTFKRDKLNSAMESDMDIIRVANTMAHEGDAALDTLLYQGLDGRCDTCAFKELYGLHPSDIVKIRNHEYSKYSRVVGADSNKTGIDEFYQKFDVGSTYWSLLARQRYQESP